MTRILLWLIFLIGCAGSDPQSLYRRGMVRYQTGHYDGAISDFARAYQLSGEPALLYDMAQAYRMKHASDKALPLYRAYLRYEPHANNRPEVEERIAELRSRRNSR